MVVGFFEVNFYSNMIFKLLSQPPPHHPVQSLISASFWKRCENEQRKVDFAFCFAAARKTLRPLVSFFCGARRSSFASTSATLHITQIREM